MHHLHKCQRESLLCCNMSTHSSPTPPTPGVTSEVGALRTVILHRPSQELSRLTPRNNDQLLFDAIPSVAKAQAEHDAFADLLRGRGVEVLYVAKLLEVALESQQAREAAMSTALARPHLGPKLAARLQHHLAGLTPAELTAVLIGGLRLDELSAAAPVAKPGLVASMGAPDDFVVDPLPNLLFTRDSSAWMGPQVAVTSLSMPARSRETSLTQIIYSYHPRFTGTDQVYGPELERVEGGDVLHLGDGVIAVGTGERTTPAGAERLAQRLFAAGLARAVLAVPLDEARATMHLDTVCTMVDTTRFVIYPGVADTLRAHTITQDGDELTVSAAAPLLDAATAALGYSVGCVRTDLDAVTAEREQWDDGFNTLAVAPGVVVSYERNTQTNAALETAGIEVLRLDGPELGSGRGGPRCMSCPVARDPQPAA